MKMDEVIYNFLKKYKILLANGSAPSMNPALMLFSRPSALWGKTLIPTLLQCRKLGELWNPTISHC